ncbi:MAG TPA: hypothetical protein VK776_10210 [Bryobacteraceae bacterium]|nr:hypothetical protein [Bryobacteraceae bacterium]
MGNVKPNTHNTPERPDLRVARANARVEPPRSVNGTVFGVSQSVWK